MRGFFIAGTDTSVGKTEVSRALCLLLRERGYSPRALKPVETGCAPDAPEDALALLSACGSSQTLDEVCPYRFRLPAAPLVAAEAEGATVDLLRIERLAAYAPLVVEAAGGLLVPLARAPLSLEEADPPDRAPAQAVVTNLDLADRLGLPIILVARASLGTINHCALSAQALRQRGLQLLAIVLNRVAADDDSSLASNARWVEELTSARVLGPTPFVADAAARPRALWPFVDSLVPRQ